MHVLPAAIWCSQERAWLGWLTRCRGLAPGLPESLPCCLSNACDSSPATISQVSSLLWPDSKQ